MGTGAALGLFGAAATSPGDPTVIVYPLTSVGATPNQAGGNVALLLSTRLAELGGLNVKPATPGTARSNFLTAALAQGADYYVTGYLTPVGEDVSLIAQVVSTQSGSIVYSTSATVRTYADVLAQAEDLRSAIVHHSQRGLPSVQDVQPAATPGPVESQGVNLSKVLGRRRSKTTATPSPAPSPSPAATAGARTTAAPTAAPTQTPLTSSAGAGARRAPLGLIVDVDGNAPAADLVRAGTALASALQGSGIDGRLVPVQRARLRAASLCTANPGATTIVLARLDESGNVLSLDVSALGCNGAQLGRHTSSQSVSSDGSAAALARAAADSVSALRPVMSR